MSRQRFDVRFGVTILSIGLFCLSGCALTRNADLHDPRTVNCISISYFPKSQETLVKTIKDQEKIVNVVTFVNRFQQGWKVSFVTAAAGKMRVGFQDGSDINRSFTLAVCPREVGCQLGMDIGDKFCYRELSQQEKEEFMALLELDPAMLTENE
jgi:hypothetical protein